MKESKRWLTIIVFLGVAIRLIASYVQPAYVDEAFNQCVCACGPEGILEIMRRDVHTPFLHLVMCPLVLLTQNIFWLRMPSVILGAATLVLSFYLMRRFFEQREALWLTALMALNYQLFVADAEFRPYGFLTCFMTLLWLGMLDIKDSRVPLAFVGEQRERLRWLLFGVVCLICGSIHYVGTIELFICCVWALAVDTSVSKRLIALLGFIGCLPSLLWLIWTRLIPHPAAVTGVDPLSAANVWHFVNEVAISYFSIPLYLLGWNLSDFVSLGRDTAWGEALSYAAPLASLIINGLLWYVMVLGYRRLVKQCAATAKLMALALLFPPFLLAGAAFFNFIYWGHPRYVVPMLAPFLVLLFSGLGAVSRKAFAAVAISGAAVMCAAFPFCNELWNAYWEGAVNKIDEISRPGDVLILQPPYSVYGFAMAYNPDGIRFEYKKGEELVCQQYPIPGKLPVLTLRPWMMSSTFVEKVLKGHRLVLVLSQRHSQYTLPFLEPYYTPEVVYKHNCIIGWGILDVVLLNEK
ncbi:hypothetical protein IJT17_07125 [bacterium]|nr:hypothetical protein [bacterium]